MMSMRIRGIHGGIQGGSKLKTGDPGFFSIVKTRGSIETTIPFYKIKKGMRGIMRATRVLRVFRAVEGSWNSFLAPTF